MGSIGAPELIVIALIALLAGMWTLQPDLYRGRTQTEYDSFMRTANVLSANAEPGQSLMLEPIGIVGYSLMGERPVRIIDEVGLVSPEVSRRRRQGPGWYSDLVAEKHPDWLAVRRSTLENQLGFAGTGVPFRNQAERDSLIAHYTKVAMVDSLSGENAILVLRRAR